MSGIADVAALAGVSKSTASRALTGGGYVSEGTRQRVIDAARVIGYVASPNAASLVTGRTKNVGVIIPFVNRWYFGEVLEGLEDALLACDYDLTLYNVRPGSASRARIFEHFLARKRFDGIITIGIEPSPDELERLVSLDRPVVALGGQLPGITSVSIDDVAVSRLATEHLIGLGHSRIVHIGGERTDDLTTSVHGRRLAGYIEAMENAGLGEHVLYVPSDMSVPGGYAAGVQVIGDPRTRPTAISAASDEVAVGTIVAARRTGVGVPSDLSVVGVDGHEYAEMFSLTTVEQSPRDQGTAIVELLMGVLSGGPHETEVLLHPTRLVVRSSTAPPRGDGANPS
ncbi:LacI family transcriptional regulator [Labedella gwakjiensis]|uniref:LacI family transcriptional regulator n=1 Tax=Labedella gwakjiensis TaxID=390269 RepID=A0A2P8GXF2_9MICO|nr:LacI family DNA-binding transcriptional regulator [Labedella gwakjiensis]PSL38634.1 LacI family transcriptional regulator [Labedella gwakjiensis]RUQ86866.1 LacI family transcriptional regulator [Labedella gwakjiensis]